MTTAGFVLLPAPTPAGAGHPTSAPAAAHRAGHPAGRHAGRSRLVHSRLPARPVLPVGR
ncbi:MAG: hypothetical protein M0Z82_16060 [Actinomycetota bacterium]|nr:hypothetical protein [Actinomycetota bacterium]